MSRQFTLSAQLLTHRAWSKLCLISQTGLICIKKSSKFVFLSALFGCLSAREAENNKIRENNKNHWLLQSPYFTTQSAADKAFVGVQEIDSELQQGLNWQPVLLPIGTKNVQEKFLLRYFVGANNKVFLSNGIPAGECITFQETPSTRALNLQVPSEANVPAPGVEGSLVYFSFQESLIGVGALDTQGKLSCLVDGDVEVSTGHAQLKRTLHVSESQTSAELPFSSRGFLNVKSNQSGLAKGDMIRVGRMPLNHTADAESLFFRPLSEMRQDDLFRQTSSLRKNFGMHEYLTTTFLVGSSEFQVPFEPGRYVSLVLKPRGQICIKEFQIEANKVENLACETQLGFSKQFATDLPTLEFDATLFPRSLLDTAEFRDWVQSRGIDLVLSELTTAEPPVSQNSIAKFVVAPTNLSSVEKMDLEKSTSIGAHQAFFGAISQDLRSKSANVRVVSADTSHTDETSVSQFLKNAGHDVIPFGGTSSSAFLSGAVPFLSTTFLRWNSGLAVHFSLSNAIATNGAVFEWMDPVFQSNAIVKMPPQQRFRGRLVLPPYNETDTLELYVNQKVFKRLVVRRLDEKDSFEFNFDEKIEERSDFQLVVMAWANSYLPETVYGVTGLRPFLVTRPLCVDANEDGKCEVTHE